MSARAHLFRLLRRAAATSLIALLLAAAGAGTFALLWQQGALKRWLQAQVVAYYVTRVQPKLPFRIEEVDADATWRELLQGRLSRLSAVLLWDRWRIRIDGPIEIRKPAPGADHYSILFASVATIEPAPALGRVAPLEDRSTPLALHLSVRAAPDLSRLEELELYSRGERFAWKPLAIDARMPLAALSWKDRRADAEVGFKSLAYAPSAGRAIHLGETSASASTQLLLKPFELGPEVGFQWKAAGAEILWGETYLDLPLGILPAEGVARLGAPTDATRKLSIEIGPRGSMSSTARGPAPLRLDVALHAREGASPHRLDIDWKLAPLPLRELSQRLLAATGGGMGPFAPLARLNDLELRAGTISTEGKASVSLGRGRASPMPPRAEGRIRIEDAAFLWRKAKLGAKGLRAELPFSTRTGLRGLVSADHVYFRRLHGGLGPTNVSLEARGEHILAPKGLRFRVAGSGGSARIPLAVDRIPLQLGPVAGRIGGDAPKGFELLASLRVDETPVEPIARSLCLTSSRLPEATVRASIPYAEIHPGDFDPDGEVVFRLFGGELRVSEFGVFNLDTSVPEIDFDLDFAGLRLQEITAWAGFGEITGTLRGHAREVTLQGALPTYFDFSIDAVPLGRRIEISPEALRNLIGAVGGKDAVDQIPILGDDTAINPFFGGLSRRLGGYDVSYAGLSLFGKDGTILLETHDPPDVYRYMKKRYIMWGHRFKMPLQGGTYPVVMDTAGLIRVLRTMIAQIQEMARLSALKNPAKKPGPKPEELPDENESTCVPPAF